MEARRGAKSGWGRRLRAKRPTLERRILMFERRRGGDGGDLQALLHVREEFIV